MENTDIYKEAKVDAYQKVTESILNDLSLEEFDWDQLIDLIIEEESPLQNLLSVKTVRHAVLYAQARKLASVAQDIDKIKPEIEFTDEDDVELVEESPKDDFADFEDMEE